MTERKIDDPETWRELRNRMREMIEVFDEDSAIATALPTMRAEVDRMLASARDAGLGDGQAAVMATAMYLKSLLVAVPHVYVWLGSVDPLYPFVFVAAMLMDVLDAAG